MENIVTKKFAYDHTSSYKSRGKLGMSNRNVRAHRASENRHQSRMDEVSKRRRMPLSPLADDNVPDANALKSTNDKQNGSTHGQPELSRREKLIKWREERKLKKGCESQKRSFVVRHVKYDNDANLFASAKMKTAKEVPLVKPSQFAAPVDRPAKRGTRASMRIAKQASSNPQSELKSHTVEKTPKSKPVANSKIKEKVEEKPEKTSRVTRQSVQKKAASKGKGVEMPPHPSKVASDPKNQVKTRSQAKKLKDIPPSGNCLSNPEIEPQGNTSNCGKANFPALEAIKNTVSVGRGSSEGVIRNQAAGVGSNNEASSFAPADFQFTAPSGINTFNYYSKTFKFQPLSPNSAAEFMFPTSASSFFSPEKLAEKEENNFVEDPVVVFNKSVTSTDNEKLSEDVNAETETCPVENMETCSESTSNPAQIDVSQRDSNNCVGSEVNAEAPQQSEPDVGCQMVTGMEDGDVMETQAAGEQQHDAKYFRNLVRKETDLLNEVCARWDKISAEEENLSEEVTGQIRTTIGQAQLLIDQRFCQFSGLIDLSEDKNAEKQATSSDLQGFWEMIYFQVEDVNAKFDALEKLKENSWQEEEKKAKKLVRKTKAKKPTVGDEAKNNGKAIAARNRIHEMRMAMKAKMAAEKEKLKADKRHQEEEAFVTILTPVKKSKKSDGTDEVVLTPVRRSIRKTPQKRSALKNTPVVVSTPKLVNEDSPGLRLTPDNADLPSELTVIGASVEAEVSHEETTRGETSEEKSRVTEMEPHLKDDEIKCEQQAPVVLKSACKSTSMNKPRKTLGNVTFQPLAEFGDHQKTPECEENEVVTPVSQLMQSDFPAVSESTLMETETSNRRKSSSKRFSGRKCRGRVSTPYYQNGTRRRVSTVDEGINSQSICQTSSDSDGSDAKSEESCPCPGLRRSTRKTPSKYRDTGALQPTEADEVAKKPADISVKLFHATEESKTQDMGSKEDMHQDLFSQYLCPSSSDEDECANKPKSSDHVSEDVFEKETNSGDCMNKQVTLTPPEKPENFTRPLIPNSASKPGRTPVHIIRYLSETATPSPNSRQITPMPKTTIFVPPNETSKTPAIMDSLGMMSPENVVRRFLPQSEASPMLSPRGVAGKESQGSVTPSCQLAAFHLDSPVNGEKRRDSVFFAPLTAAETVRVQENLMSFSPVVEGSEEGLQ